MNEGSFFQDLAVLMAAVGLVSALFARLKWPKVIGYLLAGVLMGEHTWGGSFLVDPKSINAIGQLGIVFLMFSLGLEFSADDMKKTRHVTMPTALFDTVMMIWLGYTVGQRVLGWNSVQSLFLGAAVCDSATTLLAKTIEEMKWRARPFVRFIFGTTIFEDILCVGVIALVTGVARGKGMSAGAVGLSLGGLLVFFIGVVVFGLLLVPRILDRVGRMKDDEALLLALLGCCFFVSYVAYRLDYSLAMGAFLMGVLGASSDVRQRLNELAAPLRNMFAAVFFVTIGLLVDPMACLRNLPAILGITLLVLLGKGFNCFFMSLATGQKVKDAVQTGFGLAQIGEFAFMVALMYMTQTGDSASPMYQIVVGASLITTVLNPVMLRISDPVGDWCEAHMPERMRGWLAAYGDWLQRFRSARVPTSLQKHLRSRVVWLAVLAALNLCVAIAAAMLSRLDYTPFSVFFDAHKTFFFCLAANLFCVSLFAPAFGLARALGRDISAVLTGTRQPRKWKAAVHVVVEWFTLALVMTLAFAELVMLNVNLQPPEIPARIAIWVLLVGAGVFGWKRFRQAGRAAGYRFNMALRAEKRRSRFGKEAYRDKAITLTVPSDYFVHVIVGANSPAAGETIKSLDIRAKTGASVVAVVRGQDRFRNPGPTWQFEPGDEVHVIGDPPQIAACRALFSPAG
ncbi:MAG: cation:proton antiporter [Kiritimatiellae bacterium]|nr:cation:proton antiporter [Kiritimatiellia bacterium]